MTSTWDGRVLHHKDCTYCLHRRNVPRAAKKGIRAPVQEVCLLYRREIPPPASAARTCALYQQVDCTCPDCQPAWETPETVRHNNHMYDALDK